MRRKQIMLIAGEPSGDRLAAELVVALREEIIAAESDGTRDPQPIRTGLVPEFFGAGGPLMEAAGVELEMDMTGHSVVGLVDPVKHYLKFRQFFGRLYRLALDRQPDAVVCVDFAGFNRRFAAAIRRDVRKRQDWFHDWRPKLVQYVSPQVWASREQRAYQLARDYDLLLSIFPFEPQWYARRVPGFNVQFVGHPILDRLPGLKPPVLRRAEGGAALETRRAPRVLLLPGSRESELSRHLPVMLDALAQIKKSLANVQAQMVLPDETLAREAGKMGIPSSIEVRTQGLQGALAEADLAIASTGTVTMECAIAGVPTVTLYKTSWLNYQLAKRLVKVKWLTMPNLLAGEEIFPEFLQNAATSQAIAACALKLLRDQPLRAHIRARLAEIVRMLGDPGASGRAARAIVDLLERSPQDATG